jgi:hypothetical protein
MLKSVENMKCFRSEKKVHHGEKASMHKPEKRMVRKKRPGHVESKNTEIV